MVIEIFGVRISVSVRIPYLTLSTFERQMVGKKDKVLTEKENW